MLVFINYIHLYLVTTIEHLPYFLNGFTGQMNHIYAMNLFVIESVNWFGKKLVQIGKCIIIASKEVFFVMVLKRVLLWNNEENSMQQELLRQKGLEFSKTSNRFW